MSLKFKVIIFGTIPVNFDHIKGGVEAAILNLIEGFKTQKEVEILLLSFQKNIDKEKLITISDNIKFRFIPFKYSKIEIFDYFFNFRILKDIINEFRPDIIHIQGAGPHLLRFFLFRKENIIVTQHGIMKEEYKHVLGIKNKSKFIFKMAIERYYFPKFKNIIFISNYNKWIFQEKKHRSIIIDNPINSIYFEKNINSNLNNSIIYTGVINNRKNIRVIIEALNILKHKSIIFNLHVVGDFVEKDYEILINKLIQKYHLETQIKFYGWLNQSNLKRVLSKCSYFVLPSKQETLPISVAEAMAMGKVIIASNTGAVSEMFEDQVSGFLINSDDYQMLANRIEFLFLNKDIALTMGTKANLMATAKYKPELIARKTIDFYIQVISNIKI